MAGERVRERKVLEMVVPGDIHVPLSLHRPGVTVSGRSAPTVGVASAVMGGDILDGAIDQEVGKRVGKL